MQQRRRYEGLKDKPKSGRTSHLPSEIALKIRKKLTESKQEARMEYKAG
jgi:hypothetical protein